jgi:hypothetical protein
MSDSTGDIVVTLVVPIFGVLISNILFASSYPAVSRAVKAADIGYVNGKKKWGEAERGRERGRESAIEGTYIRPMGCTCAYEIRFCSP